MENNTTFSLSVGITLFAFVVSLGILGWVNGFQFIAQAFGDTSLKGSVPTVATVEVGGSISSQKTQPIDYNEKAPYFIYQYTRHEADPSY